VLNATRFRLYPNADQQQKLAAQFGCARWVWNNALELSQTAYKETGKGLNYHDMATRLPQLKEEFDWLGQADSQVLQQSLQNLARSFDNFFQKRAELPKFKRKFRRDSIQYPQRVKLDDGRIYLPKVGWVEAVIHRQIVGRLKSVTVSREPCGHYYASVLTDDGTATPVAVLTDGATFTGVDLGLTDFAVTSKGQHFQNPRHVKRAEQNLKRKQKKLSRKRLKSNGWRKAKQRVARCHERVKNARKDFLHKLSRKLVDENQALAFEDLNVKAMVKSPTLSKAISDAGWGTLRRFCQYKAERVGKPFVLTGRFFPSSKTCHVCQHVGEVLPLDVRHWTCSYCGASHDRDENAARTIGQEAGRLWMTREDSAPGTGVAAGGGSVSRRRRLGAVRAARAREARNPPALAVG
jgi:putative transposase